jgi:hypothetical protein
MRVFIVQQNTEKVKREERKGKELKRERERRARNRELEEKCAEIKIKRPNRMRFRIA